MNRNSASRLWIAIALLLALFATACSGDDDPSATGDSPPRAAGDRAPYGEETSPVGFIGVPLVHGFATDNGGEASISGTVYNDNEHRITVNVVAGNVGNQPVESYGIVPVTIDGGSEKSFTIQGLSSGEHDVRVVETDEDLPDQYDTVTVTIEPMEITEPVTPGFLVLYVTPVCADDSDDSLIGVKLQDTSDNNHETALITHSLDGEVSEHNTSSVEDGGNLSLHLEASVGPHSLRMEYEDDLGFRGEATTILTIVPCAFEVEGRPVTVPVRITPAAA